MKDFYDFQNYYASMGLTLGSMQGEMPPEIFAPLADAFLAEYKQARALFNAENDSKQSLREAKYRGKLSRKGWKARIRAEFEKPEDSAITVSVKAEESPAETLPSTVIRSQ